MFKVKTQEEIVIQTLERRVKSLCDKLKVKTELINVKSPVTTLQYITALSEEIVRLEKLSKETTFEKKKKSFKEAEEKEDGKE